MTEKKQQNNIQVITNKREKYTFYLDETIEILYNKIKRGKIKNPQNEKIKLDQLGKLGYLINIANSVYKDKQIDRLEKDQEELKKGLYNITGDNPQALKSEAIDKLKQIDKQIEQLKEGNK